MSEQTSTIYLHAVLDDFSSKPSFHITESRMDSLPHWTIVGEQEVTFDLPSIASVTPGIIAGLEEKRDKMRAAASAAITEVDNQIASLLALEHLDEGVEK